MKKDGEGQVDGQLPSEPREAAARRQRTRRTMLRAAMLGIPTVITVRSRPAKAQQGGGSADPYGYPAP